MRSSNPRAVPGSRRRQAGLTLLRLMLLLGVIGIVLTDSRALPWLHTKRMP